MAQQKPPPPFSYTYSPNVPELLMQLNCSIAISTYQTGKVVILSPKAEEELIQLPRSFDKPMGMAIKDHKLAIALRNEIMVTADSKAAAKTYVDKPDTYDALYIPRNVYFSGEVDIHDLEWANDRLLAVNTAFSCLTVIDDNCSFRPKWKPNFVTALAPEDRCHLNGVAMEEGKPKYVTALGKSDKPKGWREKMLEGGIIMDVESNEIVAEGLCVPHTPKLYDGKLYILLSGTGELAQVDIETGKVNVIAQTQGFVRGMDKIDDYLFIAQSKIRQKSSIFNKAPVAKKSVWCGITIIHLPSGAQAGYIRYNASVEELYDLKILKGMRRPNIMNIQKGIHQKALVTPQQIFWFNEKKEEPDNDSNENNVTQQAENEPKQPATHEETTN